MLQGIGDRSGSRIGDVAVPPGGTALGSVRDELLIAEAGREGRLAAALSGVLEDYDLVLIDCAPSLDQLTINGLTAADGVVVVTQSKLWSANGLAQLLSTIEGVRGYYNSRLRVAGIIINQHEEQTVSGRTWRDEVRTAAESRDLHLLEPFIPKRVVIADATEAARGLDEWGGAEALALADLYDKNLSSIEESA